MVLECTDDAAKARVRRVAQDMAKEACTVGPPWPHVGSASAPSKALGRCVVRRGGGGMNRWCCPFTPKDRSLLLFPPVGVADSLPRAYRHLLERLGGSAACR